MRQVSSRITERGQATIPAEVRRLLGLVPHDRIVFVMEDGVVQVRRGTSAVSRTAGALRNGAGGAGPHGVAELRAAAEIALARESAARGSVASR